MKNQATILQKRQRQSSFIRQMTITGMLSAITAVLVFTPIGMIPLPPPLLSVTTVHVPVLLAAMVEGPWVGAAVGLVFGLCSFIRAWESGMVGLTLFFRNPLVSVLPRILFPLLAALLYLLWQKLTKGRSVVLDKVGVGIAAAVGTLCNTVFCLGAIALLYGSELTELINNMISAGNAEAQYINNAGGWLVAVVGVPNGIAEIIVAAVIVPFIKTAVDVVTKHGRGRKKTT
ncbi:MAG: ECF transporter S component [Eubacteriales bacterium]|nr:ECF transporter S component [Eubacteriales bacterium]